MIRLFQFVTLVLGLSLIALASAIVTMRFAIHGAEVTVPSFHGMTAREAQSRAAELGVEITIDNRFYSADVPAGRIVSQSPAAGTVVRREWHVRAAESLGPQLVAIPNLVGQQMRSAAIQLRRLGLDLGAAAHMPFAAAPPGTVIAQDPGAGAGGVERPGINVVLSDPAPDDPPAFVMPNFVGRQYVTAVETLSGAGLKLGTVSRVPPGSSTAPGAQAAGTVAAQSPPAGYRVDATMPVELTVIR